MKTRKKILLAVPNHVGFPEIFRKNFEYLDIEVKIIPHQLNDKFRYKNFLQRAHNFFRKTFLRDKNFKKKLILKKNEQDLIKEINEAAGFDYGIFIRLDLFSTEFLNIAKSKCKKCIGYQWDGLSRYPMIYDRINFMDKFYVFDTSDLKEAKTLPITNFYFDYYMETSVKNNKAKKIYYLGSYEHDRIQILDDILQKLNKDIEKDITIISNKEKIIKSLNHTVIKVRPETTTFEDNLKNVMSSSIILDIHNNIHSGLSFRIFEGIGYDKKIITTNTEVKYYDFYNPSNILIWEGQSKEQLDEFINYPYETLNETIKSKYSFTNWLQYILGEGEYIPLILPHKDNCYC